MENDRKQKELETVDTERSQRKVKMEKTMKKTTVTKANVTADDRDVTRRSTQGVH